MSPNTLTTRTPLVAAAALGVLALSACSADEKPSDQLASILEDTTDGHGASCDEDLVLSDGEQTACDFRTHEESTRVTYSEDEHAILADNQNNGIRSTIELDEEDNTALSDDPESVEYYPETISAEELEEIADEHFNQQGGMLEEGDEPPEPPTIDCDSGLDTSVTSVGEGPTCEVDGSEWEVAMESDIEILFDPGGGFDRPFVYDLSSGTFSIQE